MGLVRANLQPGVVPGLRSDTPYFSRLSARSALYTDLRLLLDGRSQACSAEKYRSLIVNDNCLARASSSARLKLWKELRSRYRLDADDPLFEAFWKEWCRCSSDPERSLTAYSLLALNDRLVMDLGTEWLFLLLRRSPAEFREQDVRAFIQRSSESHPEILGWSRTTIHRVSQHYCASIRDFGLAKGRLRKTTVHPALYGSPVRLLIRALRLVGTPPLQQVQSPIFRLLAIDSKEVIDAFGELNRSGALTFRIQGDIVELEVVEAA